MIYNPKSVDVCVLGVVYPNISKYIHDYLYSLKNQSFKNFELYLANDNFKNIDFYLKKHNLQKKTKVFNLTGNPSIIRQKLFKIAFNSDSKYFIFTDCDDLLKPNRLDISLNYLQKHDIVFNDLDIINEDKIIQQNRYFSKRLSNNYLVTKNDLLDSNVIGFTNSCCSSKVMSLFNDLEYDDVVALDWFLWSAALNENYNALFTNETTTKYRVYKDNIAGFMNGIPTIKNLVFGYNVKKSIYLNLLNNGINCSTYNQKLNQMNKMLDSFTDPSLKNKLLDMSFNLYPFWWENSKYICY